MSIRPDVISSPRLNYDSVAFLRFISKPDEVRFVFVKYSKPVTCPGRHGYYESSHFEQLVKDIKPDDGEALGIYYALNPVNIGCHGRARNGLCDASATSSCKKSDVLQRRLMMIDVDPVREADCSASDAEKRHAHAVALSVRRDLLEAGWPRPVVVDSGNGYHLLFRIDMPVDDGGLVRDCLRALAAKYDTDKAKIDTKVHDAVRLAKLPGTMACKGQASSERPHRRSGCFNLPGKFEAVSREQLLQLAGVRQVEPPQPRTISSSPYTPPADNLISRARAYLAKMSPAISGENGRNQFLNACCRMVDDFALSREQAMPLMLEFNLRCKPPFSSHEIDDKLDSALEKIAARGGPSRSALGQLRSEPTCDRPQFVGYVPDFGLVADFYIRFRVDEPQAFGVPVFYFALWNQLNALPMIPDLLLRQLIWGANFDRNWKARLPKRKKLLGTLKPVVNNRTCSADNCMLHGTGVSHLHYVRYLKDFPVLKSFRPKNDVNHTEGNRFALYADDFKDLREKMQRNGSLFNVYWPAFVLGGSPKVGWTWSQQLLVAGMVRELTRTKASPGEGIKGEIIRHGMVAASNMTLRRVLCPILNPHHEYVVFAGNGRRKGRGYRIMGRTDKGWLSRTGRILPKSDPSGDSNKARRDCMRPFLTDLDSLCQELSLIPVGLLNGIWKDIGQLMDCLRTGRGQDWLEACTLRIFAPADWRQRWRQHFSDKLGFAWIPELPEDCTVNHRLNSPSGLGSAHAIKKFIEEHDWSQKQLAAKIANVTGRHCSVRRVERNLSKKGPTSEFVRDVEAVQSSLLRGDRTPPSSSDD